MRVPIVRRKLNPAAVHVGLMRGWILPPSPPSPAAQLLQLLPKMMGKAQPPAELSPPSLHQHSCHSTVARAGWCKHGALLPAARPALQSQRFPNPDVWIYGLRLVPSSHPSRGLADSQARGLTLHRGFSSRVHGGQHEPGSNPTATSAPGAGAAAVLVEKHQHGFMGHLMLWSYGTWLFPAFPKLFPISVFPQDTGNCSILRFAPLAPSSSILTNCSSMCASHLCHGCRAYLPAHPRNRTYT